MHDFAGYVRKWRKKRGLSLGQLSLASGVNKATLSRWENDRSLPRIPELESVLNALDLSTSDKQIGLQLLNVPRSIAVERRDGRLPQRLSLGDMLFGLRQRSGKTQAEAASATGVSRSQYAHWENDANQPSSSQLHQVAFALGASAEEAVALTAGSFSQTRLKPSRDALIDCYMRTMPWNDGLTPAAYHLHLLSLLANISHLVRKQKADIGDIALIITALGDCVNMWENDEGRCTAYHRRALALLEKSEEPVHFHIVTAIQHKMEAAPEQYPLKNRVESALTWLDRFPDPSGQAYLLSFIAKAIAPVDPAQAVYLADQYCTLVADNPDEHPCRLRDRGNLLRLCGQPAESAALLSSLNPQDTFRQGLYHLDMAHCFVDLESKGEAQRSIEKSKQFLTGFNYAILTEKIEVIERRVN